jgi:peroxin-6
MAMGEFDPDAFLSSSLSLSTSDSQPGDLPDGEGIDGNELAGSFSSSSGSLTPRPGGRERSESPAKAVDELDDARMDIDGTRFVVVCAGSAGSSRGEEVCWVGVGGLGRAGIFEGDWVRTDGE